MEQVNTTELSDETVFPDTAILEKVLGDSFRAYETLLCLFDKNDLHPEWRYYKDGKSWLCKVQKKSRTILWMSAWKGFMKATIYVPERYVDGISGLPIQSHARESILAARNVGKSKPCMFEVRDESVLKDLETVIKYKIALK